MKTYNNKPILYFNIRPCTQVDSRTIETCTIGKAEFFSIYAVIDSDNGIIEQYCIADCPTAAIAIELALLLQQNLLNKGISKHE